jgi:hypothetical protein
MTDQPLTEKLTTLLAQVDEATNMTRQQMDALGKQLGGLYQVAEAAQDQSAMTAIALAWEQAQALNAQAVDTNAKAVAIATVATDAILQRDAIKDEFEKLDDAISEAEHKGYSSHPRIKQVLDSVREQLSEEMFEDGLHLDCPGCEACDGGWMELIDHDFVNNICYALFSGDAESIIASEYGQSFADAINAAGDLIQHYYDSQRAAAHVDLDAEPEE